MLFVYHSRFSLTGCCEIKRESFTSWWRLQWKRERERNYIVVQSGLKKFHFYFSLTEREDLTLRCDRSSSRMHVAITTARQVEYLNIAINPCSLLNSSILSTFAIYLLLIKFFLLSLSHMSVLSGTVCQASTWCLYIPAPAVAVMILLIKQSRIECHGNHHSSLSLSLLSSFFYF